MDSIVEMTKDRINKLKDSALKFTSCEQHREKIAEKY